MDFGDIPFLYPPTEANMFNQQELKNLDDFFAHWGDQSQQGSSESTMQNSSKLPAPIITEKLHLVNSHFVQNFNNLKKENLQSAGSEPLSASSNMYSAVAVGKPLTMYTENDAPQSGKSTPNTPTPPLSDSSFSKHVNTASLDIGSGIGFGPGSGAGRKRNAKVKKEPAAKKSKISPNSDSQSGKNLLTEEEKKHNHVVSEQRRRQAIRDGFDEIVKLTPSLLNGPVSAGPGNTGGGHSKSTILNAAAAYILELQEEIMKLKNENFKLKSQQKVLDNSKIDAHQAIPSLAFQSQQHFLNTPTTAYPHHGASFLEEGQDQFRGRYGEIASKSRLT